MATIHFTYSGNVYDAKPAGTVDFPLTTPTGKAIPYLQRAHIHVMHSTDKGKSWSELTRPAAWDFASNGTVVRFKSGIGVDEWVMVRRITPYASRYTTFQDSSQLTAEQLNDAENFSMYVDQELYDLESQGVFSFPDQIITKPDQLGGHWVSDDAHLATTGALSERFDVIMSDTKPPDPPITDTRQPGKLWINTSTLEVAWWSAVAKAWIATGSVGPQGAAATITVGSTTTAAPGAHAAVTNSGTQNAAVLDFVLPQGPQGLPGSTGPAGPPGGGMTHVGVAPITVSTAGTTVTYGFDLLPLATLP